MELNSTKTGLFTELSSIAYWLVKLKTQKPHIRAVLIFYSGQGRIRSEVDYLYTRSARYKYVAHDPGSPAPKGPPAPPFESSRVSKNIKAKHIRVWLIIFVDPRGFEPPASSVQMRRSTK